MITITNALEYAFNLATFHTKLTNTDKLTVNEITELWKIQDTLSIQRSSVNESKALKKDIIDCYATLLIQFQ